ncbi:lytic murein transglycosylase [Agrobacterium vitis]|nr:lytic murein transglycosylase [Allorhizobium ampelinum]
MFAWDRREPFTARFTPLCPAGHLPLKGGDRIDVGVHAFGKGFNFKPCPDDRKRAAYSGPISPLEGEMPGKAEGGEPHGKTSPS